jgi:cytosine/uracil/thiamine/allantoin permease
MIEAIWPSFATWHLNSLPKSDAITAPQLLCFSLFWLASFPFLLISVKSLRWIFLVKIVLMPFFYVALFTWALTASNGFDPLFSVPNNITFGWSVGYVFCSAILAIIGGNASMLCLLIIVSPRLTHSTSSICCEHGRHHQICKRAKELNHRPGSCSSIFYHHE